MDKIRKLQSVGQFNAERGQRVLHPLVSVLDQSQSRPVQTGRWLSELYIVFLKQDKCAPLVYGRQHYDYDEGTMLFIAPGQVFGLEEDEAESIQPTGWALAFHPDLIRGTALSQHMKEYSFFAYEANEALHLSDRERALVVECFRKIGDELAYPIDKHSKRLIATNIELLLNYCVRFYDRQFITRDHVHKDVLVRFEALLDDYFGSNKPQTGGLPTVRYCAEQLHLSANYFGDLVKKETGQSAQDYIQTKVIELSKERMFDLSKSISEIAYEMGFKYPQHFTRLFKQRVGQSPNEYRRTAAADGRERLLN
ncbi:AraC family transcriptional regulator [Spirosoma taeanense]|uniref:AraC family transcriptional regulator n=1 Tax=Spirosoma taeanense TaxID=2735870 RepID=A0A6M5Y8J8_9BACT|nr:helix-turn-helix domain-containing protein [Spirosoma taeanense]QJW89581.1 AraC family transcriptional regulator [Spirosoma taeanense]